VISSAEKSLMLEISYNSNNFVALTSVKTIYHHPADNSPWQIGLIQFNFTEKSGINSKKYGRITNKGIAIY